MKRKHVRTIGVVKFRAVCCRCQAPTLVLCPLLRCMSCCTERCA